VSASAESILIIGILSIVFGEEVLRSIIFNLSLSSLAFAAGQLPFYRDGSIDVAPLLWRMTKCFAEGAICWSFCFAMILKT